MWIEELPNGKYKYFERYKDPYTEKYRRVSVTLNSKSNQAKKQAMMELQDKINNRMEKKDQKKVSLENLLNSWWQQHQLSIRKTSVKAYGKILKYIFSNMNVDVLIRNTDTKFFQDFINDLPHSWEYKKKFKSVLNMSFTYAQDMGMIDENPINRVKVVKPPLTKENFENIESKYLEEREVYQLLSYYYSTFQSVHHGRLAEFMYLTGLRAGEAISLTINDYVKNEHAILVNGTLDYSNGYKNATKELPKTLASFRKVELSNRAVEIIEELILEREIKFKEQTNYLFVGKTGNPIQVNSFNASLKKANESLGKNKINKTISSHIF
ncbi:tyrosine-type recombinase/integrase [Enterococcus faecalis]|nr:tyrosine-type recombinase/integrase [Enterococcus faecalis]WPL33075.1 tyrosine-type recombinase/integrase [Enterococcus faecalis]